MYNATHNNFCADKKSGYLDSLLFVPTGSMPLACLFRKFAVILLSIFLDFSTWSSNFWLLLLLITLKTETADCWLKIRMVLHIFIFVLFFFFLWSVYVHSVSMMWIVDLSCCLLIDYYLFFNFLLKSPKINK